MNLETHPYRQISELEMKAIELCSLYEKRTSSHSIYLNNRIQKLLEEADHRYLCHFDISSLTIEPYTCHEFYFKYCINIFIKNNRIAITQVCLVLPRNNDQPYLNTPYIHDEEIERCDNHFSVYFLGENEEVTKDLRRRKKYLSLELLFPSISESKNIALYRSLNLGSWNMIYTASDLRRIIL